MRCNCELARREAWNDALNAAAHEVNLSCGGLDHLLVERILAMKKPDAWIAKCTREGWRREISPPGYIDALPGFLK